MSGIFASRKTINALPGGVRQPYFHSRRHVPGERYEPDICHKEFALIRWVPEVAVRFRMAKT